MTAVRCPRRHCGELAELTTDGGGHVVVACPPCQRNARGICRDCPRKLTGRRRLRCDGCAARRKLVRHNQWRHEKYQDDPAYRARAKATMKANAERHRAWYRDKYRTDPAFRAHERKRNQQSYQRRRDRILAQKRVYYKKRRDAQRARMKAWRDKHPDYNREYSRDYYRMKDRPRRADRRRKAACKYCGHPMPQRMKLGGMRRVCEACQPLKYVRYRARKRQLEREVAA